MQKQTQLGMKDGIVIDYVMLARGCLDAASFMKVAVTASRFSYGL